MTASKACGTLSPRPQVTCNRRPWPLWRVTFGVNRGSIRAMTFAPRGWFQRAALLGALGAASALPGTCLTACQKDRSSESGGGAGTRAMDGLERYTRRTVSLETAVDAIRQRDVKKLKMLSVYVRKRDKTALFSDDDLSSLELAIVCLEGSKTEEERRVALAAIHTGTLKKAAREACLEEED